MKPVDYSRPLPIEHQLSVRRRLLRIAGIGGIASLLILSLLPGDLQAPLRTGIPGELEHLAAYAVVAFCLRGGFTGKGSSIWIVTSLAALAGLMELLQALVPARGPAFIDAVAGAAGALLGSRAATFHPFTKK
jgi:VanZ family protein